MKLWWQPSCQVSGFWSVFIHWIDIDMEQCLPGVTDYILGQYDTMPSGGDRPFPAMRAGFVYPDTITVHLRDDVDVTSASHIQVGLYDAFHGSGRAIIQPIANTVGTSFGAGQCNPETIQYALR